VRRTGACVAAPGDRLRTNSASPWLPAALLAAILAVAAIVSLAAPPALRYGAVLATGSAAFVAAYAVWPRPALVAFALFMLFERTLVGWISPGIRHVDDFVIPALVVLAALRARPWRGRMEPLREGALLVVVIAGVASSLTHAVPVAVWAFGLFLLLKVFAFMYVVTWHDFSDADVRQAYPIVLAVGALVLALAGVELIDPAKFHSVLNVVSVGVPRADLPSVTSVFFHPMLFAWFTGFLALFMYAGHVVLRRWWLLAAAMAFSVGTVLAGRRRAIAGVAAGLASGFAVFVRAAPDRRRALRAWLPVAAGTAVLTLAFLPWLIGLATLTLGPPQPDNANPDARVALYKASVAIAADNFPFGVGLGRFGSPVSRDPYSPVYAAYGLDAIDGLGPERPSFVTDAFWPRILGETGVIGLAALLMFTAAVALGLWRAARARVGDPLVRAFLLGSSMVFAQAIIETLASAMFESPQRAYLLFGTVGVALSIARRQAIAGDGPHQAGDEPG
jgi:hypothetical protein